MSTNVKLQLVLRLCSDYNLCQAISHCNEKIYTLAMRHGLNGLSTYWLKGQRAGDEHPTYAHWSRAPFTSTDTRHTASLRAQQHSHVFLKQDVLLCDNFVLHPETFNGFILYTFQVILLFLHGLHSVQLHTAFKYTLYKHRISTRVKTTMGKSNSQ